MQELKDDLKEHMAKDRLDFEAINEKLDNQSAQLNQLLGQWKLVGGILGVLSGLATGWIF